MAQSPPPSGLVGLILAGGEARRMHGRVKALEPFRGQPLVSYAIRVLSAHCDRILLSTNRAEFYDQLGLCCVADVFPGLGPVAGLHAGLAAAGGSPVLVLPCDVPLLEPDDMLPLIQAGPGHDIAVYGHERGPEPLIGWYAPSATPYIQAMLETGRAPAYELLSLGRSTVVPWTGGLRRLSNVNRLEDLRALEREA